jgi:TrmH family RNA methyltransferase
LKLLTQARDLKRRKARDRSELFVAEGIRVSEELLRAGIPARGALITSQLTSSPRGRALLEQLRARVPEVLEVDERDFSDAADTDTPQGVLLIAEVPPRSAATPLPAGVKLRVLLLDGVQDPGNVGTMVRTAAAFGAAATIALPGTVDLWNAKVVRSAMGAHFSHLAFHASFEELTDFVARENLVVWGTEAGAPVIGDPDNIPERLAIAFGNEGAGMSPRIEMLAARTAGIATAPGVESLNVAVAAGILLHDLSN